MKIMKSAGLRTAFLLSMLLIARTQPAAAAPAWGSDTLKSVTYAKGIFVAVGSNGAIVSSTDGSAWTKRDWSGIEKLRGVTYGNNLFAAVGESGTIITSSDGASWTARSSGITETLGDIVFGNGLFIAVGDNGVILSSSDGVLWAPKVSGTTQRLNSITFGNGKFVSVSDLGTVLTSADGALWTAHASGVRYSLTSVSFGNGMFVASGVFGTLLYSTGGDTWSRGESGGIRPLFIWDVAFGNGMFLAAGGGGMMVTSSDGIHWNFVESGIRESLFGVTYGLDGFVAVGSSGEIMHPDLSCSFTVSPSGQTFASAGGTGSITVTASPQTCKWTVINDVAWIKIASGPEGTGDGTVSFVVGEKPGGGPSAGTFYIGGQPFTVRQLKSDFADIPSGYWAYDFIDRIFAAGITSGCGNGNYCPEDPVTRGQMAVFILKSLKIEPAAACNGAVFGDVTPLMAGGEGFCRYVEKFSELGITAGCGGGNYCPDNPVTRAQMAVFITKALSKLPADTCGGTTFDDVNSFMNGGTVFCKYIEKFKELNITSGCGNNNYCPDASVTRAQMAVFLAKGFLQ